MQTSQHFAFSSALLCIFTTQLVAQENYGPIQVSLDKTENIVLTGKGEKILGIDFQSKSGSLIPGHTNEPFQVTLANSPNQVTYGAIGSDKAVTLDGSLTLTTRWNALSAADVQYEYGLTGSRSFGPFELFREVPDALDVLRVSLNESYNWVLHGTGERLAQFDLSSNRGGLIAAQSADPFLSIFLNDENAVRFVDPIGNVSVDGDVTLSAGWSYDLGIRDVKYWYRQQGKDLNEGPYVVPESVYPPRPPGSKVGVTIDDADRRFVLRGEGHQLRTFELQSPSGSLLPAESIGRFDTITENTKTRVAYAHANNIQLDGTLKLDSGYDIDVAGEDVSYRYQQLGHASLRGPFDVRRGEYPPNPRKSPLRMAINDDLTFVVEGIGQPVTALTLNSVGGSLTSRDNSDPFQGFVTNTSEEVSLVANELLRIDGSVVLPVGWNEAAADVEFVYSLDGVNDPFGPIRMSGRSYPAPNLVQIAVSLQGGSIAMIGNGQLINGFEVHSEDGSLEHIKAGSFGPFTTSIDPTSHFAKYTADEPVAIDWLRMPFLKWNQDGEADLHVVFDEVGERAIVGQVSYVRPIVPEPSGILLLVVGFAAVGNFRRRR